MACIGNWFQKRVLTGFPIIFLIMVLHQLGLSPAFGLAANLIPVVIDIQNGQIHGLRLTTQGWRDTNISAAAGAPSILSYTEAMEYRRNDGISTVIFNSGHILELWFNAGVWHLADLTANTDAPLPSSDSSPFGYVRSDGLSTIVYTDYDGHIIELRLEKDGWHWADLTAITNAPKVSFDVHHLSGYVRSDGISSIVYHSSLYHICELALVKNGWMVSDLTANTGAPVGWLPWGYVRGDGISTIVYTSSLYHICELALVKNDWKVSDLTVNTGAPEGVLASAYVRSDGSTAVLYRDHPNFHLYELRLNGDWAWSDLTSISNAPDCLGAIGYVRGDGISAAVCVSYPELHIIELRLQNGWQWTDLTALSGSQPVDNHLPYSPIWAYNREVLPTIYLPLILR